jgi:serine/threonine protein kinase
VDRDYFAALNSVSEAVPSTSPNIERPVEQPSRLAHLMNGGYYRRFFQEEKRLGSGGYGAVYLVRHQIRGVDLGHYAMKKVPCGEDEEWLVRVLREVTVLQGIARTPRYHCAILYISTYYYCIIIHAIH